MFTIIIVAVSAIVLAAAVANVILITRVIRGYLCERAADRFAIECEDAAIARAHTTRGAA